MEQLKSIFTNAIKYGCVQMNVLHRSPISERDGVLFVPDALFSLRDYVANGRDDDMCRVQPIISITNKDIFLSTLVSF